MNLSANLESKKRIQSLSLTVSGADEGEAGDDPEEGHVDDDEDDDVLKDRAALLSLNPAGPQPIRDSGRRFVQLSCQLVIRPEEAAAFSRVTRPDLLLSDWLMMTAAHEPVSTCCFYPN